jgi:alcohol dehydrogenase class IV
VVSENDTHLKRVVFSPKILARMVFADPELTLGLPPAVTAATGMDALTHNIESYLSPAYHPLCDGIALEGTRIAAAALLTAVTEPGNLQARSDMMMASMMGAIAFQKDLGAVHSAAHALGAVCDLHHGLANALMIDTVMAWNYEAVPAKFDELAHVCKVAGGGGGLRALAQVAQGQRRHHRHAGLARRQGRAHSAHGGDRRQDICHQTNPRPCTAADFERCSRRRCRFRRIYGPAQDRHQRLLPASPTRSAACSRSRPCSTSSSRWRTGSCRPGRCP